MADLFDALVARALGEARTLAPVVSPRFAGPVDLAPGAELDGPMVRTDTESGGLGPPTDRDQPALAVPAPGQPHRPLTTVTVEPASVSSPAPLSTYRDQPPAGPLPAEPRAETRDQAGQEAAPGRLDPVTVLAPATVVGVDRRPDRMPVGLHPSPPVAPAADPLLIPSPRTAEPTAALIAAPIEPVRTAVVPMRDLPSEPAAHTQVTISIGQVEVRAPEKREPARPARNEPNRWPQPRLSLDDYLRRGPRR
jgi:hypothetical protein